ncbi:hypothetical protein [Nitrosomonas sp.]|uniref:hypothetical protein n=1 Tax=Nitrosomonas sp. TaxID=42353 RepID=UPI0025D09955|nr:hypothetical protein [Nitrosomonas sp.]MBV6447089.1 hypothetical protein [Nitrosomonas sp.]
MAIIEDSPPSSGTSHIEMDLSKNNEENQQPNNGGNRDGGNDSGSFSSGSGSPMGNFINAFCDFFNKYIEIKKIELTHTEIEWRKELFSLLQSEGFIRNINIALDQLFTENGDNSELEKKVKKVLKLELWAVTERVRSFIGMGGSGTNADDQLKFIERERDNILTVVDSCREALDIHPLLKFVLTTGKEIYQVILK